MDIPSYDDLTPPIPDDISPRETSAVERFLASASEPSRRLVRRSLGEGGSATRQGREREGGPPGVRLTTPGGLFACLRSRRSPDAIVSIAREFSPRIERYGASAVVLDISGLGGLLGEPDAIGAELDRAASPHPGMAVAIAPTQVAALLLSLARPTTTIVTGDPAATLAPLPLAALQRLLDDVHGPFDRANREPRTANREPATPRGPWPAWAPCAKAFDVLERWGLKTIGELAALPSVDLSERLGQPGIALQRLAHGIDPAPLAPDPGVPRYVQTMELEWPIDALEPLSFVLARLLDPVSAALERDDRGAAALRLDLRLVDRTTHARVLPLPAAMRDARVLRTLLLLDLERHPPSAAIDVVTIEADPAPGRIVQYSLLERATASPETIATLTARLGALVGESRCGSPVLLDTHRPDGFEMRRFDPAAKRGTATLSASPAPEREAVPLLRRFRPPVAIRVRVDGRRPVHVAIDRKGMPGGRVQRAAGPWRTSGEWWNPDRTHWDRDEWDIALADGSLCRLFCDRTTGRWFMDAVVD